MLARGNAMSESISRLTAREGMPTASGQVRGRSPTWAWRGKAKSKIIPIQEPPPPLQRRGVPAGLNTKDLICFISHLTFHI